MIEFETEDREKVMILIPSILSFEKLNEKNTLIVLNYGVEYNVKSTYSEIKNVMLDFYAVSESTGRSELIEDSADLSSTYTEAERENYSNK